MTPVNNWDAKSMTIPSIDVSSSVESGSSSLNKTDDNPTKNTPMKITAKDTN